MEQIGDSIKEAQETRSRSARFIKQFSLAVVSAGLLIADWWLLKEAMFGGHPASFWAWPISATALWIIAISFYALVNRNLVAFFALNAVGVIAYLAIMPRNLFIFAGGLVFFSLSMLFQRRIGEEEKNQLNFSIRRTLGNSQTIMTYALLVLVGCLVYSNVSDDFNRNPDEFYRKLGETAVRGVPYLSQDSSKYNLSQSVGDFFRKQAQDQYPEFNQVSSEQQNILLNEISNNFQQQFGIHASQNTSLRVAMTQVITERLRDYLGKYERFFPLIFTIAVIAILRTFAFVFNWIVLLFSWILFRILLLARFFRIGKRTVEVEKVEI